MAAATLAARDTDWVFPGVREWGAAIVRGLPRFDPVLPHGTGHAKHIQDEIAQAVDPSLLDQIIRDGVTYQVNWNGHDVVIEEPITESAEPEWKWVDDPERKSCHVARVRGVEVMVYLTQYGKGWRWGVFVQGSGHLHPSQFMDTGLEPSQTLARRAATRAAMGEKGGHVPDLPESRALNSLKLERGVVVVLRDETKVRVQQVHGDGRSRWVSGEGVEDQTGMTHSFYHMDVAAVKLHGEWHKCRAYLRHGTVWLRLAGVTKKYDDPEAAGVDLPEAGIPALVARLLG